jgi:tetratricopeptide (TPR) repeat protein
MSGRYRTIAMSLFFFLALAGCGWVGDKPVNPAVSTGTPAQTPPAGDRNYPAFTADQWLNQSRTYYQEGKYLESVGAAQTALYLRPDFAEAYNNIGAAYAALHLWDPAIQADQQAVRLNPSLQLARNNLAWALTQKSMEKR